MSTLCQPYVKKYCMYISWLAVISTWHQNWPKQTLCQLIRIRISLYICYSFTMKGLRKAHAALWTLMKKQKVQLYVLHISGSRFLFHKHRHPVLHPLDNTQTLRDLIKSALMFNHLEITALEPWLDTFQCFCISKVNKHPASRNAGVERLQFPHQWSRIPAEGPGGKEKDKNRGRRNSERQREVNTMLKLSVTVSFRDTEHLALSLKTKAEEKCGKVMGELAWQMPLSTAITSMSPPRCFSPVTFLPTKQLSPFSLQSLSHAALAPFFFSIASATVLTVSLQTLTHFISSQTLPLHCFSFYLIYFLHLFRAGSKACPAVGWTWKWWDPNVIF